MSPAESQVRVTVYRLEDETKWTDKGTGFCTLEDYQGVLHLNVVSESELNRLILDCIVQKGEVYQQQESTLIVWTEPTGEDLALSFQEQEGCLSILNQITEFENAVKESALSPSSSPPDDISLPPPSMGSLAEIEHIISEAGRSLYQRDRLVAFIMKGGYLKRLRELHETCEDLDATDELHTLYRIARHIILLNDSSILECIIRDENIIGVVGMLEYDPHSPVGPGTYRGFLRDHTRFKEVVPIRDADIQSKIHQTFRLQYLKDVVLPQIADEGTLPIINTLIFFNHVQIANYVHCNEAYVDELVGIVRRSGEPEKKRDVVMLLHQFCTISKGLPVAYRAGLYRTLSQHGLLTVLEYALRAQSRSLRSAGLDMLMSVLEQDCMLVRARVLDQQRQQHSGPSLFELVIDGTRSDIGSEAHAICCEAMRMLLDTWAPPTDSTGAPTTATADGMPERDASDFLALFYDTYAREMVAPLARLTQEEAEHMGASGSQAGLLLFLCDLLSSMARCHGQRARALLMSSDVVDGVTALLAAKPSHLRLAALRVIKACLGQQDDALSRYLIAHGVFGAIIGLLAKVLPRDNLVSSACRDLLALVANHSKLSLLAHILGAHSKALEHIPGTHEFLRQAYDARLEKAEDRKGGGVATPTVDAGRQRAVSINMLVGHYSGSAGTTGASGGGSGGPWGSTVIDEIEDAYLESFDEGGDLDGPSRPAPLLASTVSGTGCSHANSDTWAPEQRSPELEALQGCLDSFAANEARWSTPPLLGSGLGPASELLPAMDGGDIPSVPRGESPGPPSPLARQGSLVDTRGCDNGAGASGREAVLGGLVASDRMSVADAFPDSRPIARKLGKRPLGGSAGTASQIRISMSLSARSRPKSADGDGSAQGRASGGSARPSLAKRQLPANCELLEAGYTANGARQVVQETQSISRRTSSDADEPVQVAPGAAVLGPARRSSSVSCSFGQESPGTAAGSSGSCRSPPKKARTASS
ncbi:Platinum sensitivity protein [Coemansia biformis]|uniref:Platinum sensitivity protein n=1 Tax=Coemansia biformis TaxID=1286918 RepID=A0A9W8CYZ0_9FUNG|nr:Platinum sensitivity protein [Coemansia biformis]